MPHLHTAQEQPVTIESLGSSDRFLYDSATGMGRLMSQVRIVAPQDTTVLLSGETGTGKTHLAHVLHELSSRSDRPFLVVNCGALSDGLIESEMFGHVKGAFTGADRDRAGKFHDVGTGTLLLDEVDALPFPLQAKLLRAVEERVFEPVGSNQSLPMRARLIAASNRALEQDVAAGRFRSDLYYRLNVVGFTLPPLRQQRATIAPIASQYIAQFAERNRRPVTGLSPAALEVLEAYSWPGNIRELRNVIERAVALCAGPEIEPRDFPEAFRAQPESRAACLDQTLPSGPRSCSNASLESALRDAELSVITETLLRNKNNRVRAAQELGISRMTLYKKLRKLGLMNEPQQEFCSGAS